MPTLQTFRSWLTIRVLPKGRGWRIVVRHPRANIVPTYRAMSCSKDEAVRAVFKQWTEDYPNIN